MKFRKKTKNRMMVWFILITWCLNSASQTKERYVKFVSSDSTIIDGLIEIPVNKTINTIVIEVNPCLVSSYLPNRDINKKSFTTQVRNKLIENGVGYFRFLGRKDSIVIYDRRYPTSTMFTKEMDLEAAIHYLRSQDDLKKMKIILYGISEGGMVSTMAASRLNEIKAMVLISTPGVSGPEFIAYQRKCQDSLFMWTYGTHPEVFKGLNCFSSLDSNEYKQSFADYLRFKDDNYLPLEKIANKYDNPDSIAHHILLFLEDKWKKEDEITRAEYSSFQNYCIAHHHFAYIQPEQIAHKKWNPELYFPKISCPILALYGTKDRNVEYSSSILNITKLTEDEINNKVTFLTLENFDHGLQPPGKGDPVIEQEKYVNKVIEWILKN